MSPMDWKGPPGRGPGGIKDFEEVLKEHTRILASMQRGVVQSVNTDFSVEVERDA